MSDAGDSDKKPRLKSHFFLKIDAWLDSTLWNLGFKFVDIWEDITIFFRRFRVKGWKRIPVELAGEALTRGAIGMVAMLALAKPAFEIAKTDWRRKADFAVTFLDRYGNVVGHRGIIHEDSVPIDELPDHLVKAVLATGKRRVGLVGLAFKPHTDDLRESPLVTLAEALIGKGCALRILDENVALARLVGANRQYITEQIPHIAPLMCASVDELLAHAEVLVIGHPGREAEEALAQAGTLVGHRGRW